MSKQDYVAYLKSSHWRDLKEVWYSEERNRKCAICDSNRNLNIHHKRYRNKTESILYKEHINSRSFPKEDLITLCQECHLLVHRLNNSFYIGVIKILVIKDLLNQGYSKTEAFTFYKTHRKQYNSMAKKHALKRLHGTDHDHHQPRGVAVGSLRPL